jgi:hypothetical protein
MEARRESLPTVTLALVIGLGERRELFPLYDRDLLVDAAAIALRDMAEEAHRTADPVKMEETVVFARLLRRLVPELRDCRATEPLAAVSELVQ